MEKSKNQILAELYAIKAGLSVISLEKEKLNKEEIKTSHSKRAVEDNRVDIEDTKVQIASLNNKIETLSSENVASFNERSKKLKKERSYSFDDIKDLLVILGGIIGVLLIVGGIISLIASFVYSFVKNEVYTGDIFLEFIKKGLITSFLLGVIVCIGVLWWNFSKNKKECNAKLKDLEKTVNQEKENLTISLQRAKASLKDNENTLKRLMEQTDSIVLTYNKNLSVYNQTVEVTSAYSKIVYDSLVLEYNSTLNSSEWSNLDLIIYYFETGRAESIKEALQLMDKQKQHDELVSTLKEATASICGTIQTSINYLRSEMASCFNQLFSQMEKQHSEIMSSLSKISDNISENNENLARVNNSISALNSNLSQIYSQESIQGALIEKINVSSAQLVSDANYMLSYYKTATK